jgi:sugar phosphate isomerase/epimerase
MGNDKLSRRRFISAAGTAAAGLGAAPLTVTTPEETPRRKFYAILSLGRLGFGGSFEESVSLAEKYGFEGVDPDPGYFAKLSDDALAKRLDDLKANNLRLGAAGLPVEFREDDATFSEGLKRLPDSARELARAKIRRVSTWILPFSDHLTYLQNFRTHAVRLRECALVLADHGQQLGLEYVAPRTLWRSGRHPFIHTLSELRELMLAIGTDNLGVQLDSWHWFNSEGTRDDLLSLRATDVVTVDLNDAPSGLTLDQYRDDQRELPAATGVIPIKTFLEALAEIGYDGPAQAEPFNAALRALPVNEACARTAAALHKAFAEAGV